MGRCVQRERVCNRNGGVGLQMRSIGRSTYKVTARSHSMRQFLVLCALCALAAAATPQCSWQCDNPVCSAVCTPVCAPPACTCQSSDVTPTCSVACNATYNGACPDCETLCTPDTRCSSSNIMCEVLSCGWDCVKPVTCTPPTCQLQCEQPICSANVTHNGGEERGASAGCAVSAQAWSDSSVIATVIALSVLCASAVGLLCIVALRRSSRAQRR